MKKNNKAVIYWLLTGCILIFIMVVVGGITRLTHSGLSISNYKLISGTIPPMNATEWNEAFDLYKQYPEYQLLNYGMSIEEFKDIYFWEWIHRVIGRFIGVVFIVPFLYFLIRKQLSKSTIKKSIILLVMGGFQGFLGWYMVKSGLDKNLDELDYDDGIGIDEIQNNQVSLIRIIDILGREQKEHNKGTLLFYIYDNGQVEKRLVE